MNFYTLYDPVRKKQGITFSKKTWLVMKMVIFLICATVLQVSASVGYAQKVTLNEKDASLRKVFNDLKKQTGYIFFYEDEILNNTSNVNLHVSNTEMKDVLDLCLKDQPLQFVIEANTVAIKRKEPNLIDKAKFFFAQVTVTAKVVDELGNPLPGVTVTAKDTQQATATDKSGSF